MDLKELVSILENLTDDCQQVLWDALKEIVYRRKGPAKLKPCDELDCIVKIGLLDYVEGKYDVPETAKKKIRKLYTYLVRKFDVEYCLDAETLEEITIPKGSEFVCTMGLDGESKLALQFPDDEITALLNLFGVNRCDNWPL